MDFSLYKAELKTPCYVIDLQLLLGNLEKLNAISGKCGCKILLAQKAFSCYELYGVIGQFLQGSVSSGLFEARLGAEHFGKENHIYSPAYDESEIEEILRLCGHIVFNSERQWQKYAQLALSRAVSPGLRINPEFSTQSGTIYDPCAEFSRLGVPLSAFDIDSFPGLEGVHIHTLCEQGFEDFHRTFRHFESQAAGWLSRLKWINLGGGQLITKEGYPSQKLESLLREIKEKYGLTVYLEPGEAVVYEAGFLVSTVREIIRNKMNIALLDASAACHMPDVLEMPYRPPVLNAGRPDEKPFTYRLSSVTCLAGDIAGDYSFEKPLTEGDRIIFGDMAHYTMVKNNTFNGVNLPSIYLKDKDGIRLLKSFGYEDFKSRL